MSSIYYYGSQPMLKFTSDNTPCAVPIDKKAADFIEQLEAELKSWEEWNEDRINKIRAESIEHAPQSDWGLNHE